MSILPRSAGIYRIDGPNGKVYIGSSRNLQKRIRGHRNVLDKGTHPNRHLQHAWDKYGQCCFSFSVVEVVDDVQDLIRKEQLWLDILFTSLEPEDIYNMARFAASSLGVKQSEETRRKISERLRGNSYARGMKHTQETLRKISESNKGNTRSCGRTLTEQHKKKCSESLKLAASRQTQEQKDRRARIFSENWAKKDAAAKARHAELSRVHATGQRHTDESRKRMSDWHRGKVLPTEHRDAIARSQRNGEIWTMISPDGQVYEDIGNVMEFAKAHGLNHKTVRSALRGHKTVSGWRGRITRKDT